MQDQPPMTFDPTDPTIKNDLNLIILQYLQEQQLYTTANAIQTELALKISETAAKR
jgi:hypothetical protein